jgi:hypothetical protein
MRLFLKETIRYFPFVMCDIENLQLTGSACQTNVGRRSPRAIRFRKSNVLSYEECRIVETKMA